ncbi:MAG: trehalose-phosphatase [Rhizobiales bacterium]|nr:trehalose-phosphatase [Hyphomicrobiales bacterium]
MIELGAIAGPPPLGVLQAEGPLAFFLDFDGTLVEIASSPEKIQVPRTLPQGLIRLALREDGRLALISGRTVENLRSHLGDLPLALAGSHGAELFRSDGTRIGDEPAPLPAPVGQAFASFAARHSGVEYEAKKYGAALHYRIAPELEATANAFAQQVAAQSDLRLKHGKCVVELVRWGANKGDAVRAFMAEREFSGARPVFVGDDLTDEDGFAAVRDFGGFGVIVGQRSETCALYRLAAPRELGSWLQL